MQECIKQEMVAATYDNIKFTNEMAANQPHNIAII
jgi:hypothetical protein